jgi:serine protease inhibitor
MKSSSLSRYPTIKSKMNEEHIVTATNNSNGSPAFDSSTTTTASNLTSFAFNLFSTLASTTTNSMMTNTTTTNNNNNNNNNKNNNNKNVLISPISIASALALVLAGSTMDSIGQKQIQTVLQINNHSDIPLLLSDILSSSASSNTITNTTITTNTGGDVGIGGVDLISANGIWTTNSIKKEYIETVEKIHDAKVDVLPTTFDPINEFVEEKTQGKITDLLQGDIDPLTVAVLVNAVYFKGRLG